MIISQIAHHRPGSVGVPTISHEAGGSPKIPLDLHFSVRSVLFVELSLLFTVSPIVNSKSYDVSYFPK